ncbi:class I SAM-dependent methyltransferase [Nocardia sp. NBC_00508]|uniref:class I SAM-dependent methyltransferase n=1 Tax=Nocardia sp. NBC_00508 TaxID=2975992 RepID=UPI002E81975F|nr:class I SAM-dependent methyltransferase [Nocardia sp. NBC_00508]WUD70137.1 class I SAM-dependent methyltransferase [Nocardia sp. NBC_00508]
MPEAEKIHVDLTGAPQTMLATLYAKALDAEAENPLLGDTWARDAVRRIDYDWRSTRITRRNQSGVTVRTVHFDNWAREFLALHDRAAVLHLGCGLDSRAFRLDPGPEVEWYDVDYPEVITLHEQLYPAREHHHRVAASVTDPAWLQAIPADRPVLMIAEGLTMYLTEDTGVALLRAVVEHFPSGELQFDAFNALGIRSQKINPVVRRSGATLYWAINGPDDIVSAVPGVRQLAAISVFDSESFQRGVSGGYRLMGRVMSLVPAMRMIAQYHRYAF